MRWRRSVGLLVALSFVAAAREEAGISVRDAWIRQAPPGASMLAGYMELRNSTSKPQILVAAGSSEFESVTIHRTVVKDGMAGMVHVSQVEIPPQASIIFAPGGYHLMLMTPKRRLRAGDSVIVNLELRDAPVLAVVFEIRK